MQLRKRSAIDLTKFSLRNQTNRIQTYRKEAAMQLLIFIAAIGFFVLRILASSKKKQPETAENGAANRFAENESDEFAFGTGFAQGETKACRTEPNRGQSIQCIRPLLRHGKLHRRQHSRRYS